MAAQARLICASASLCDGGDGFRFEIERHGRKEPAFAIRHHGRVYAYLNRCSHVPVEIDWQPGKFFDHSGLYLICATHGALYAPESGACLGGRCGGRGLSPLRISEHDGQVFLIEGEQ
ncbi:MAG: Rieske 2Fe-2S domain-containing protein [Proteobacteria bacterium]|nr:Rieske 2Fe-2S domain-containing protein [Pseudomonadota bacterium]HQR03190.1 Rieske 2Fe-2S domain-containing protein [Rhodocyclaceae bacterium]